MTVTHYDIIGDIHGRALKLIDLLKKLGYRKINGVYQQQGHQAIFVGDFIDRGTEEKPVLDIVRSMMAHGHARAVMGNHEFNAICYHTGNGHGGFLRSHNHDHNEQHRAFLNEYPLDAPETAEIISWFKSLPLFLELDGFRVIHACWDERLIAQIKSLLDENGCLKPQHYLQASEKGTFFYQAIETLLKGPELTLPEQGCLTDKDGTARRKVRIKWWQSNLSTYKQAAVVSSVQNRDKLPDLPIPDCENLLCYPDTAPPVFFGHYWFSGKPQIISHNAVCLDYSAARAGQLVAYRFCPAQSRSLSNADFFASDENL
jgi:hypothetical protein